MSILRCVKNLSVVIAIQCFYAPLLTEAQWSQVNLTSVGGQILSMIAFGDTLVVGGWGGALLSGDYGVHWASVGLTKDVAALAMQDGSTLYAGTRGGGVFRSSDYGRTWSAVNTGLDDLSVTALAAAGGTVYVGTAGHGVYRSGDRGDHWLPANDGLGNLGITALAASGSDVYAGSYTGVFHSANKGNVWFISDLTQQTNCLTAVSGNEVYSVSNGTTVKRSTDSGATWTSLNAGYLTHLSVYSIVSSRSRIFAGTSQGLLWSDDKGDNWTFANTGFTSGYFNTLAVCGPYIFGGSGYMLGRSMPVATIWRRKVSEVITSARASHEAILGEFYLRQNFPNPFNPSTTLSFSLPSRSFATLKIFDVLGKEVATIVNEELPGGNHSRMWNASAMPSGMYYFRLQADGVAQTKKLMLVR